MEITYVNQKEFTPRTFILGARAPDAFRTSEIDCDIEQGSCKWKLLN